LGIYGAVPGTAGIVWGGWAVAVFDIDQVGIEEVWLAVEAWGRCI
jgi:hypothetical protein